MDTRLDLVAKTIAQESTRRQALRRLGGSVAGGVLAALGLSAAAVQAQTAPSCPTCRQCISQFFGECVSVCSRQFTPESCTTACCEGAVTTCAALAECTPTCTATCPLT